MMFGFAIGLALGGVLLSLAVEEEHKNNSELKKKIGILEEDLDRANFKNELKDEKINDYQEEHVILLENACETRAKIIDLENNLELVTNSLRDKNIKELSNKLGDIR